MIVSLIISLILTFLLCLIVDIKTRDIVLVAGISTLLILILEKLYNTNHKLNNLILNTKLPFITPHKNDFTSGDNKKERNIVKKQTKLEECGIMGCPMERLIPKKYGEIIPPDMYNQEDCTTDLSCIQKADENNLFPGFCGNKDITAKISDLDFKISKMENNIKNMKSDDGIFVEHFQNERSPQELNDVILPFNKDVIRPYESHTKKTSNLKEPDMMETNGLCFHCKVGYCEGGVCKPADAQKNIEGVNTHKVEQSSMALSAHPFTDEQPVIPITNPGQHDFE